MRKEPLEYKIQDCPWRCESKAVWEQVPRRKGVTMLLLWIYFMGQ